MRVLLGLALLVGLGCSGAEQRMDEIRKKEDEQRKREKEQATTVRRAKAVAWSFLKSFKLENDTEQLGLTSSGFQRRYANTGGVMRGLGMYLFRPYHTPTALGESDRDRLVPLADEYSFEDQLPDERGDYKNVGRWEMRVVKESGRWVVDYFAINKQ